MDSAARTFVAERALRRCEYCLLPEFAEFERVFHVEHIVARQHGGGDDVSNLAWACSRCNCHKGPNLSSVDPATGTVVELFHPRLQSWQEHFTVVEARIIGLTAVGRATCRLLRMNDHRRVQVRRMHQQ
jgi:hypothetical protein